jgi:hypothetical protein
MDDRDKSRHLADVIFVARMVAAVAVACGLVLGFSLLVVTLVT